ncbi:hypothetical protein ACFL24_02905 [Patescibacteria group bacterium]
MKGHNVGKVFLSGALMIALVILMIIGATCEKEPEAEPSTSVAHSDLYEEIGPTEVAVLVVIPLLVVIAAVVTLNLGRAKPEKYTR